MAIQAILPCPTRPKHSESVHGLLALGNRSARNIYSPIHQNRRRAMSRDRHERQLDSRICHSLVRLGFVVDVVEVRSRFSFVVKCVHHFVDHAC